MRYWRPAQKSNCSKERTDTQWRCSYVEILTWSDSKSEKAEDFHAGDSGDAAGGIFQLVGEFFVDAAGTLLLPKLFSLSCSCPSGSRLGLAPDHVLRSDGHYWTTIEYGYVPKDELWSSI